MKKDYVNVHVVVDKNSVHYFDYLVDNFLHCADRPQNLRFSCYALDKPSFAKFKKDRRISHCCDVFSTPEARRYLRARPLTKNVKSFLGLEPFFSGSDGHSVGLNVITRAISGCDGHNVIADSDVAMITKSWDTQLIDIFEDYQILGTTYEDFGGFSSGQSIVQTYKKFPNANWLALRDDVDIAEFDWMPRKGKNLKIDSELKSAIFNLPVGFEMVCDGGWWFPQYCAERKYKALSMKHVKPSSDEVLVITTESDYNEEYQLLGTAFVAHQRGGSRHEFKAHEMSKRFYDCVEAAVGKPETS